MPGTVSGGQEHAVLQQQQLALPGAAPGEQGRMALTSPLADNTSAILPQVLPLKLGVVSSNPGLGRYVQIRLDEMTPQLYQVSQVETLVGLEMALRLGAAQHYQWVACLIDMAFPPLNQSSEHVSWLARLTRIIALVEEDPVPPQRVEHLCRLGFLAVLSLKVPGWVLYDVLARHLQQAVVQSVHTDQVSGRSAHCPSCQASVPYAARFCGDCGVRLPVSQ